uniref:Uncharacterized protein n=1 Tax=Rhizophora mucronata TaxID=61149 RepID=A0A2P2J540_RHIMU
MAIKERKKKQKR